MKNPNTLAEIMKEDIPQWHEKYTFPLDPNLFTKIYNRTRETYHNYVVSAKPHIRDLLIAEIKLPYLFAGVIYQKELNKTDQMDYLDFKKIYWGYKKQSNARLNWYVCRYTLPDLRKAFSKDFCINIGRRGKLKEQYLKSINRKSVDLTYYLLKKIWNNECSPNFNIDYVSKDLSQIMRCVATEFDIKLPETYHDRIFDRLFNTAVMYENIKKYFEKTPSLQKKHFLMVGTGKLLNRLIALCASDVTIVSHGDLLGFSTQSEWVDCDMTLNSRYIVDNDYAKENIEKLALKVNPVIYSSPDIISLGNPLNIPKNKPGFKTKKLIIIDAPLYPHHHPGPYLQQPLFFHLTISILKCTQKYNPCVSLHPDNLTKYDYHEFTRNTFTEQVEQAKTDADTVILSYLHTSCLCHFMKTSMKIIYFDTGYDFIDKELLNSRCHAVKCAASDDNLIRFDEEELIAILEGEEKEDIK